MLRATNMNLYLYQKYVFGLSFLLRQGQACYMRYIIMPITLLANTPKKVKNVKMAKVS